MFESVDKFLEFFVPFATFMSIFSYMVYRDKAASKEESKFFNKWYEGMKRSIDKELDEADDPPIEVEKVEETEHEHRIHLKKRK